MTKVTNNTLRLEGVHTKDGLVYLQPGQTKDVDFTDAGLKMASRLPFLGIEGVDRGSAMQKAPSTPITDAGAVDREDVKKQADELSIKYARNIKTEKLQELIDAKLAE